MFAGLVLAWVTWPIASIDAGVGPDPAFNAGLHMAKRIGFQFGRDIVYTYGPLGFASQFRLYYPETTAVALIYGVTVHFGFGVLLLRLAARALPVVPAVVLTYAVLGFAAVEPAEIVVILAFLVAVVTAQGSVSPRVERVLPAALASLAGMQLLVKFNTGVVCLGLALAAAIGARPGRVRRLVECGACFAVSGLAFWVIAGGSLGTLPDYLGRSVDVARGYTTAMAAEDGSRKWEYAAAVFISGGLVVMLWRGAAIRPGRRVVVGLVLVAMAWAEAKRGFVRHDAHSYPFFLTAALVPLAFTWRGRWRPVAAAATVGVLALLPSVYGVGAGQLLEPRPRLLGQATDVLVASRRDARIARAREGIRDYLRVEPDALSALRGHRVHIDPLEATVAWAYGLRWQPVPAFQAYLAFTPSLDRLNARALLERDGPDRVLRAGPLRSPDGRFPLFESPEYMVTLLCNFGEITSTPRWQVLGRVPDRCGDSRKVGEASARSGDTVPIPAADPGTLTYARLHLTGSRLQSLLSVVYKRIGNPSVQLDRTYRLVTATADRRLLLCVPEESGYAPTYRGPCPRSISVLEAGDWRVEFFRMRIDRSPTVTSRR